MKYVEHVMKGLVICLIFFISDLSYAESIEKLIKKLKDPDWSVRSGSAESLGILKDPAAVPALLEALIDKDNDEDVKWNIILALGEIKDKSAVPALIETMRQKNLQNEVVTSLRKIGKGAVPNLLETLKDKDKVLRWNSAALLGDIGDQSAITGLVDALKNDKDEAVQDSIRKALNKLGWKE